MQKTEYKFEIAKFGIKGTYKATTEEKAISGIKFNYKYYAGLPIDSGDITLTGIVGLL